MGRIINITSGSYCRCIRVKAPALMATATWRSTRKRREPSSRPRSNSSSKTGARIPTPSTSMAVLVVLPSTSSMNSVRNWGKAQASASRPSTSNANTPIQIR